MADSKTFTLHEKLIDIQQELHAPKNAWNDFNKFNYRNIETILAGLKPLLKKHGLTLLLTDHVQAIGEHTYVEATAQLSDGENELTTTAYAREDHSRKGMDMPQLTGSASSYARKYALGGMFAIDDGADDPDKTANKESGVVVTRGDSGSERRNPPSEKQIELIKKLAREIGTPEEALEARLKQITSSKEASEAIDTLTGLKG